MKLLTLENALSDNEDVPSYKKEQIQLLEVTNEDDFNKIILERERVAEEEFLLYKKMENDIISHSTWISPISRAMFTANWVNGLPYTELLFYPLLLKFNDLARRYFEKNGVVYFAADHLNAYESIDNDRVVKSETIDDLPRMEYYELDLSTLNIVLENDNDLSSSMKKYLEENDISYSLIKNLRKFIAKDNAKEFLQTMRRITRMDITRPSTKRECVIYLETTGVDKEQVEDLAPLLTSFAGKILVMTDNMTLFNEVKRKYEDEKCKIELINE